MPPLWQALQCCKVRSTSVGYHPYREDLDSPKRQGIWVHHDDALNSTEDTDEGAQAIIDYVPNVSTVPYYRTT